MRNLNQSLDLVEDMPDLSEQPAELLTFKPRTSPQRIGYGLLLGGILLISCGLLPVLSGNREDNATVSAPQPTESLIGETPEPEDVSAPGHEPAGATAGDSIPKAAPALTEPDIGEITFALDATEAREPVDPALLFTTGITQVHAIFDYSGMSTTYTWDRVWYLNDTEVSKSSSLWSGPESGVFDYFIDNGGKPLPSGDWILEIYVEGKLQSLGVFIIEDLPGENMPAESSGSSS